MPPHTHTLETAFPEVTTEHYAPVPTKSVHSDLMGPPSQPRMPEISPAFETPSPPSFFLSGPRPPVRVSPPKGFSSDFHTGILSPNRGS